MEGGWGEGIAVVAMLCVIQEKWVVSGEGLLAARVFDAATASGLGAPASRRLLHSGRIEVACQETDGSILRW